MGYSQFSNDYEALKSALYNTTSFHVGGLAGSDQKFMMVTPPLNADIKGIVIDAVDIISDTSTASSAAGSKEWTFQIANLTDSLDLLSATAKTSDTEITGDAGWTITPDQNNTIGAGKVLELQVVKTGSPTDLGSAEIEGYIHWHYAI